MNSGCQSSPWDSQSSSAGDVQLWETPPTGTGAQPCLKSGLGKAPSARGAPPRASPGDCLPLVRAARAFGGC